MGWRKARLFLLVALVALFMAGGQNAFFDASRDKGFAAGSILADYSNDRILQGESRNWRYKGRNAANGPAFPGANSYAVAVTDFSNWTRFWQLTFLSLGGLCLFWCGYYWPVNMRWFARLSSSVVLLAIGHLVYYSGHYVVWYNALPAGSPFLAQTGARAWIDCFIFMHDALQARGVLG